MLALLGAMREEVTGLKERMSLEEALAPPGCRMYAGKYRERDVLLVQTGIGRKMAERAVELALKRFPITGIVSFGFSGALTGELKVGDVVLCPTLQCVDGHAQPPVEPTGPCHSDTELVSLAVKALESNRIGFVHGTSITTSKLVWDAEAKYDLGRTFSAEVVDMESYWIARIASGKGIPFLSIRTVSDAAADTLPPLGRLVQSDGRLRWKAAALYFLPRPRQLLKLIGFFRKAQRASQRLTTSIECLVAELGNRPRNP